MQGGDLPLVRAPPEPRLLFCALRKAGNPPRPLVPSQNLPLDAMPRVLIADDNEMIRRSLKSVLFSGKGWLVCGEATNGLQAVQMVAKLKPDVILLDFQMPVMNGVSAAKEIIKDNPSIPVAMYTLTQNIQLEAAAKAVGVRKVISKADIFSALAEKLNELLAS